MSRREDDGDLIVYDYMPEKKGAPKGTVAVNADTGERVLIAKSVADEFKTYAFHAMYRIERMLQEGQLETETYAAWY